jgi:hypothetical protein
MTHNLNRHAGNCWSRERGYHTPESFPPHIERIIRRNAIDAQKANEAETKEPEATKNDKR